MQVLALMPVCCPAQINYETLLSSIDIIDRFLAKERVPAEDTFLVSVHLLWCFVTVLAVVLPFCCPPSIVSVVPTATGCGSLAAACLQV